MPRDCTQAPLLSKKAQSPADLQLEGVVEW